MKKYLNTGAFLLISMMALGQTGTSIDPFTSLDQATAVSGAGEYHFSIGGQSFRTHVDATGYIQVALDFGNGSGALPQSANLNTSTRGILNIAVLATLSTTDEVRITSSTGNIDVSTTDGDIINRLLTNTTLHQGLPDNGMNDLWTGMGATNFTGDASSTVPINTTTLLDRRIFHPAGNDNGFHWQPSAGEQRERLIVGEVSDGVIFQLWVRDNPAALPIELLSFDVTLNENNHAVLNWKTSSETNNDYFTIERSVDASNWEKLSETDGSGNSSIILSYQDTDRNPYFGVSYYRLKQTDFDGQYSYSPVRKINNDSYQSSNISIYPNPFKNQLTIEGSKQNLGYIKIINVFGQEISTVNTQMPGDGMKIILDLSHLKRGIYYVKTNSFIDRIYKQ